MAETLPPSYRQIVGRMRVGRVPPVMRRDLTELAEEADNLRTINAARKASASLRSEGVRHAILGGIAVGVLGWPRLTLDVDLLVGDEAWIHHADGSTEPRVSLPETIDGVGIDYLPVAVGGAFLAVAFERPYVSEGVPIAPPEVVVCTKLLRHAMRDRADVVELIKAAVIDLAAVRAFLAEHTPMLVRRWEVLLEEAAEERKQGV
jgi:hypothetical protein